MFFIFIFITYLSTRILVEGRASLFLSLSVIHTFGLWLYSQCRQVLLLLSANNYKFMRLLVFFSCTHLQHRGVDAVETRSLVVCVEIISYYECFFTSLIIYARKNDERAVRCGNEAVFLFISYIYLIFLLMPIHLASNRDSLRASF